MTEDYFNLIGEINEIKRGLYTPKALHYKLVNAYCSTSGLSHELLNNYFNPLSIDLLNINLSNCMSVYLKLCRLGYLNGQTTFSFLDLLETYLETGYVVFPFLVSNHICTEIVASYVRSPENVSSKTMPGNTDYRCSSIPFNGGALMYKTNATNPILKSLHSYQCLTLFIDALCDFFACSRYKYILKQRSLVWSLPSKNSDESLKSELAQLYHFDLDSLEWHKFFIYLNKVSNDNGPHQYISGSHKPGSKCKELLAKGYSRHSRDDIISSMRNSQSEHVITGPAGTIFLANTKCWHRGLAPRNKHRILMSNVYCSHPVSMQLAP